MGGSIADVLLRRAGGAAFAWALAARRLGPWLKLSASLKPWPRLWLGRAGAAGNLRADRSARQAYWAG